MERLLSSTLNGAAVNLTQNITHNITHGGGHGTVHAGSHHLELLAILSPFAFLVFGAAIKHMFSRVPIPYTVLLLGFGFAIGMVVRRAPDALGTFSTSVQMAAGLDPHMFLFIFLPPLIFESAFSLEWHMFKQTWQQAMWLAGPGLVFSTTLTGLFTKFLMYPNWTWEVVMLFGAILSATDPVAVVALLKDLGAKKSLAALIEGESLMNDGTAVVVFTVLLKAARAGAITDSAGDITLTFVQMAFGGAAWGLATGVVSVWWLGYVFNNAMVEITITLCTAYLTFFLAEFYFHFSGVLALVVLGVYYGSVGRTSISPDIEEFLHEFWEMLAYMANTLVFILTGVIIAVTQFQSSGRDWAMVLVLYTGCHVARLFTFVCLYPAMRRHGYGLSLKEMLVCVWGGLRGAVGLALGLVVYLDPAITAHYAADKVNTLVLFHTAGLVLLTLCINSTTIKYLLQFLGMDKVPVAKERIFKLAMKKFKEVGDEELALLKADPVNRCANWPDVRKYSFHVPTIKVAELHKGATQQDVLATELHEARRRFLVTVKASYWNQFKSGLLGRHAVRELIEATDQSLDCECDMEEWLLLQKSLAVPMAGKLNKLMYLPVVGRFARSYLFSRLQFGYDIASSYLVAREEATDLLTKYLDSETIFQAIKAHAHQDIGVVKKALFGLQRSFPEISASIATNHAARTVLNCQKREVHHLYEEGMLDTMESSRMTSAIGAQMKRLLFTPPTVELPNKIELLREVSWLESCAPEVVDRVAAIAEEQMLMHGSVAITQGEPGGDLYIIARGTVEVILEEGGESVVVDELGVGSFIGEMSWVTQQPNFATVRANSGVIMFRINGAQLTGVVEEFPSLKYALWRAAGCRIAEHLMAKRDPYNHWPRRALRKWVTKWRLFSASDTRLRGKFKEETALVFGSCTVYPGTAPETKGDTRAGESFEVIAPAIIKATGESGEPYSCMFTPGSQILYPPNSRVTMAPNHWKRAFQVMCMHQTQTHDVQVRMMGMATADSDSAAKAEALNTATNNLSREMTGGRRRGSTRKKTKKRKKGGGGGSALAASAATSAANGDSTPSAAKGNKVAPFSGQSNESSTGAAARTSAAADGPDAGAGAGNSAGDEVQINVVSDNDSGGSGRASDSPLLPAGTTSSGTGSGSGRTGRKARRKSRAGRTRATAAAAASAAKTDSFSGVGIAKQ